MSSLHRIALIAIFSCSALLALPSVANTPAAVSAHCKDSAYRQFDFWLGDWDTFRVATPNQPSVARNHVTAILGGCVLREVFQRTDGYTGESYTIYDATRKLWHQSWVTNEGELLVAEGTQQGKQIVLTGSTYDAKGETVHKVSWEQTADGVRETATASSDGGKTWAAEFDIVFRKHH
ncbi:hypothetical protein [Dyella tabacisoli]|nr:hypothetical protein [Dyella tabacisoli]